ncbi:hypothetical protein GOV14_03795 [Candidatus Pacearchaeota archaeon]|nr:hypothetical protein [Candidatus Pacearchaeota archaeon]
MEKVGFTTGCLFKSSIPFNERINWYNFFGADAIELSFATPDELLSYELTPDIKKGLESFDCITVHAPWKQMRYDSDTTTTKVLEKLKVLDEQIPISGMVVHPDTIYVHKRLENSKLPFLLENMDKRKKRGIQPEEFEKWNKDYGFGYVLDLQHVYEHDPSMSLTNEFLDVMGDRLAHMHVSGENSEYIHVPVYLADNKQAIEKVLKLDFKVPKILEGILTGHIDLVAKNELELVRSYDSCQNNRSSDKVMRI